MENLNRTQFTLDSDSTNQTSDDLLLVIDERDEELARIEIIILCSIFLLTVFGNTIVLFGIYFKTTKMTRMYYFIMHLSIADLTTAFFNVLPQIFWEMTYRFKGGNVLCKAIKYLQILGPYSSSYVLVMTALDRYHAICFPLHHALSGISRESKINIGIAWTLSFLLCIPQLFVFSYQEPRSETHPGIYDCWATFVDNWGAKAYVTWYCITVFILPLLILTFAYTKICQEMWIQKSISIGVQNKNYYEDKRCFPQRENFIKLNKSFGRSKSLSAVTVTDLAHLRVESIKKSKTVLSLPDLTCHNPELRNCDLVLKKADTILANSNDCLNNIKSVSSELTFRSKGIFGNRRTKSQLGIYRRYKKIFLPWSTPTKSCRSISRTKIKTIKFTVTVICLYIFCSSPFIAAQLWLTYDSRAAEKPFYSGATFTILTLLASLNSCVNPWIYLIFNPSLLQNFSRAISPQREEASHAKHAAEV